MYEVWARKTRKAKSIAFKNEFKDLNEAIEHLERLYAQGCVICNGEVVYNLNGEF